MRTRHKANVELETAARRGSCIVLLRLHGHEHMIYIVHWSIASLVAAQLLHALENGVLERVCTC